MAPRNNSGAPLGTLNLRGKPLNCPRHEGPMRPDRWPSPRWPRAVCPAPARIPQRHRAGAAGGRHPGAAGCPRPRGRQRRGRGTALPGRPRARRAGARDRTGSGTGGARPSRMPPPTAGPISASWRPTSRRCRHSSAFDHACANPPYHGDAGTPSPDASRRAAKRAADRAAGRLGNRTGTPVAAARHAHLHPAGRVAGGGDDGIRRCRLRTHQPCCRYGQSRGSRRNCCCCAG